MGGDDDKSARALRASEARFRVLANATREAVVIHEEGVIWEVNRAFTQLVGFEREQIVGKNGLHLFIAPESREIVMRSMASEGSGSAPRVTIVTQRGERRIVDSYSEPFVYLGRPMRVVTMRDVTGRLRAEQGEQRPEVAMPAAVPRPTGREMILLVEDDPQVRSLTARLLRGWGYRVLPAADPADAVRVAAEHPGELDLILSDIVMPGRSGPELVTELASTQPRARTLFVSGYPGDEIERFGLSERLLPILAKPYSPDELALRVRHVLDAPR